MNAGRAWLDSRNVAPANPRGTVNAGSRVLLLGACDTIAITLDTTPHKPAKRRKGGPPEVCFTCRKSCSHDDGNGPFCSEECSNEGKAHWLLGAQ